MSRIRAPHRFHARYGPWAVVTGASDGIGRECSRLLAEAGLNLVLVARRGGALAELAGSLPTECRVIPADLADADGVSTVLTATADLDIGLLVAAAGFGTSGPFLEADPVTEQRMLALNCAAVAGMTAHYGRRFADRGRGGIVLFASLVGRQGTPHAAHYAATKAYVQTLAEGLRPELARHGVDMLAGAPGPVHSGFAERAGMTMTLAARPDQVAAPTLNALGRRTVVAPGALSTILTAALATLPRPARTRIMGMIMKQMADARPPGPTARAGTAPRPGSPRAR